MDPARALKTVAEFGARALSSTPLPELLDTGAQLAREVTESQYAVFFERSPGGDALLMRAGGGWRPGVIGRVSLSTGAGSFGRYVLQQPSRLVGALPSHPDFGVPAVLREHAVESMACVRLDGLVHPLGTLALFNLRDEPGPDALIFLQAIGNVVATAILRQVTEEGLLQSQIRLQSVQKMEAIGRLAGGIAHDFNNLVQAIGGYTEILLRHLTEGDPLRRNAEEIKKAGDRAAALTRQLLAFSRQQVLQPSVLDLNGVVHHVEQLLIRLIGADIHLRTYLSEELWPIKADAVQLEQVLMNLAVNARDAMHGGGVLTIETANVELTRSIDGEAFVVVAGPYVLLAVTDTGAGMNAETKARAFEPFFTTKPPGQGTGLGLSMVYGIVKQSGGYIWVDSELGAGTRIRIYLPRADSAAGHPAPIAPALEALPPVPPPAHGSETLLLVEDEAGVRELIHEWLAGHGYTVHAAEDGVQALDVAERLDALDLLVADVVMPTMGGPALAKRLLQSRPDLKVIFVSGYADEAIGDRRMLEDGAAFLQKPFTLDDLLRKVREVLGEQAPPSRAPGEPR
ncbi:MAG: response regulator [Acidobacteria bacterium]|nr:response regulator [Acidobacteriota bacterium]